MPIFIPSQSLLSATHVEVFGPDHRFQNGKCKVGNELVRYTIDHVTPGHPLVEVYDGSDWVTIGNFQLQAFDGVNYTPLEVREFDLTVVSPEEIIWDERRYDLSGRAFVRLVNRIRRGSRLIECQVIAASGQGLIGAHSVGLTNTVEGNTAVTIGDGTASYAAPAILAANKPLPGFCFLTRPVSAAAVATGALYAGLHIPTGTVGRFSILAGVKDAQWVALGSTDSPYATQWSSYNRTRVRQRTVI